MSSSGGLKKLDGPPRPSRKVVNILGPGRSPDGRAARAAGESLMTIEEMERQLIGQALSETEGNRTHAAKLLGISVRKLILTFKAVRRWTLAKGSPFRRGDG